ncbi:5857_t:CDS:1, partial [Racocetra fulgida]
GSMTTTHGVKIAFASGILDSTINNPPSDADILLTFEWPKDITRLSSQKFTNVSGSTYVTQLVEK